MSMTVFDLFNAAWPVLGPLVVGFLLGLLAREIIRAVQAHKMDRLRMRIIQRNAKAWQDYMKGMAEREAGWRDGR